MSLNYQGKITANPFEESLLVSLNIEGRISKHATLKQQSQHLKLFIKVFTESLVKWNFGREIELPETSTGSTFSWPKDISELANENTPMLRKTKSGHSKRIVRYIFFPKITTSPEEPLQFSKQRESESKINSIAPMDKV